MTREETQKLLAMMQATYPNYNPIDKTASVNVWFAILADCDWKVVQTAFVAYVRENTSGFAPTPGQIIEKIQMLTAPEELNEMEAWSMVSKAIRNSGYSSQQEFDKLPETVKQAVGSPNQLHAWAIDSEYNESVVSSHFVKCYRTVVERKKAISKMPQNIRNLIERTNSKNASIESKNLKLEEK